MRAQPPDTSSLTQNEPAGPASSDPGAGDRRSRDAEARHQELGGQFGEVAVVTLLFGLVPRILGLLLLHGRHHVRSRGPPGTRAGR